MNDADKGKQTGDMGLRAKLCLAKDTLVLLADGGYTTIDNVNIGDNVITHLGKIKPVIDKWSSTHHKYIKLTVAGETIKLSLNHNLLIKRDNIIQFVEAKDIIKTDKILKLDI